MWEVEIYVVITKMQISAFRVSCSSVSDAKLKTRLDSVIFDTPLNFEGIVDKKKQTLFLFSNCLADGKSEPAS